ncbi:beta-ketoacyl synthase N-terminal-like domain-containing protein [Amycolatopsis anabasis]|uniref:beta-ketoacyl synthase N-terminal-like domain-containing protein n=1 Tax=Amycolatopsis anabasis TaxID=1840409 RepID=UPI002483AC2E|nr:beta-ketoacyl synthase N-terminal-like domain-containing protein [Amycolatopsis anabasis]
MREVAVTGQGVQCAVASGVAEFATALALGTNGVSRRVETEVVIGGAGGWLPAKAVERWSVLDVLPPPLAASARPLIRRGSRSLGFGLIAACEAWLRSGCGPDDAESTAVVVGGTNQSPMQGFLEGRKYVDDPLRVRPGYAAQMWDTHLAAVCGYVFGTRGEGVVVGGASAAGNSALVTALRHVRHGVVDRCLVVFPPTELSPVELIALRQINSLHPDDDTPPEEMSRPFDAAHRGFVLGEGAAAVVIEAADVARARGASISGYLAGGSIRLHGSYSTEPSVDGEVRAITAALADAGVTAADVGYVNAHATSTPQGDLAEAEALDAVFGPAMPPVNSTKALIGHCLGAAAGVELVACLQQLAGGFLHPSRNVVRPVNERLRLVGDETEKCEPRLALSNAFGFGGINTSLVVRAGEDATGETEKLEEHTW